MGGHVLCNRSRNEDIRDLGVANIEKKMKDNCLSCFEHVQKPVLANH